MSSTHTPPENQDVYIPPLNEAQHPVVQWLYNILPDSPSTPTSPNCKLQTSYAKPRPLKKRLRRTRPSLQERGILRELSGNRGPMASPEKQQKDAPPRRSGRLSPIRIVPEPSTPRANDIRAIRDEAESIFDDEEETPQASRSRSELPFTATITFPRPKQPNFFQRSINVQNYQDPPKTHTSSSARTSSPSKKDVRSSSPTKKKVDTDLVRVLRGAVPKVICDGLEVVFRSMTSETTTLLKQLSEGVEEGVIPVCMKSRLQETTGAFGIPSLAYDTDITLNETEADDLWDFVRLIFDTAKTCRERQRDENAWCENVVLPLMNYAAGKPFKAMLEVVNIQSQKIDSAYVPVKAKLYIEKKADYAWYFSPRFPIVKDYYDALENDGFTMALSQMNDTFTGHLAMFCGAEVKKPLADGQEGLAQLALWLAAGLRKTKDLRGVGICREGWWKQRLAQKEQAMVAQGGKQAPTPSQEPSPAPKTAENAGAIPNDSYDVSLQDANKSSKQQWQSDVLPLLGWVIQGHQWSLHLAWLTNDNADVQIAGPLPDLIGNTATYRDIFKLIAILRRVETYGREVHWPWLETEILKRLRENPLHDGMPKFLGGGGDAESESVSVSETVSSG
ncbi:MAG: hypothetical protein Q9164_005056 [Protoblastenia rupestris]